MAIIALLVALGGTAVPASTLADGSVTTPKLANSAVKTAKLANSAVTSAKVAKGTLDASRFQPNVLGGISSSKVTIVAGTPISVPANNNGTTATATCPAGQRAISGGFNVGTFGFVDATGPTGDGLGWSVTAEAGVANSASISATVVCVAP